MKTNHILFFLTVLIACSGKETTGSGENREITDERQIEKPQLQSILDAAKLNGAILIYDVSQDTYYSNDFKWANKGNLPASTFKITNSIIALETAVVANDSTLFKWDGKKRRIKNWEQDLIFRDAFHLSCVPCYQGVARKIGEKRMNEYLDKLRYGDMKVDTTNIDVFWLEGDSKITQFSQIDFLKRFYDSKLPIAKRTETIMKRLMLMEDNGQYKLSGKTGWSVRNGFDNGWFVGYLEVGDNIYFFATNVEPGDQFDMDMFSKIRKTVTFDALKQLNIMPSKS